MSNGFRHILAGRQPQSMDALAAYVILFVGPAYLFIRHFHFEILDPTNIYWLMQFDWGQHALGLHAFLHSDWGIPLTHTDRFFHPEGADVALTDSNPLLAIPLKFFSWALPDNFQIIGPWLALCVFLQIWTGYLLLRLFTNRRWVAALAAIIFGVWPPLYFRMDHDTLTAHWLLMLGMWVFFAPANSRTRLWRMTGLAALAACIHPMMFLMIGVYWSAEVLRLAWRQFRKSEPLPNLALYLNLPPAAAFCLFYMIGTLPGGTGGVWGFGEYSMNLNSPFNPLTDWGSTILPALQTGKYQYEGYAYFGVGLLLMLVLAAGAGLLRRFEISSFKPVPAKSDTPSVYWLIPALIACFLLALSTTVRLGDTVLIDIPLSRHVRNDILGPIRASGRFFWPVAYFLIFLALRELLRLPPRRSASLILIVLCAQLLDLRIYSAAQQNRTGLANEISNFRKAGSPVWRPVLEAADHVVFLPPSPSVDKTLFYELSWRAISHGASINTMYMSRLNEAQRRALRESEKNWRKLGPQPRTLYVFLSKCSRYAGDRNDLRRIDGVLVLPPPEASEALKTIAKETCR